MKTPIKCLRSQSFWLLLFINGVGTGSGLTLLNNLGQQARLLAMPINLAAVPRSLDPQ